MKLERLRIELGDDPINSRVWTSNWDLIPTARITVVHDANDLARAVIEIPYPHYELSLTGE